MHNEGMTAVHLSFIATTKKPSNIRTRPEGFGVFFCFVLFFFGEGFFVAVVLWFFVWLVVFVLFLLLWFFFCWLVG